MSNEGPETLRINQFLARAGVASRRAAEALVLEGRVTLNGQVVTELATSIDPARDAVKVDGRRVHLLKSASYFALYKPKEVVSTLDDPEGRPCLTPFLPKGVRGLFPVGRLDYHSEGLLLLTSDGEMANRLLHPRYKVVKTYHVKVKGDPSFEALERLRRGVILDGRRTQPVNIRRIPSRETRHSWLEIEMTEGRKNQLREMFFRVEHPVIKLKRVALGPVRLGKMRPGDVRPLSPEEEEALKRQAGLIEGVEPPPPRALPERPRVHRPKHPEGERSGGAASGRAKTSSVLRPKGPSASPERPGGGTRGKTSRPTGPGKDHERRPRRKP